MKKIFAFVVLFFAFTMSSFAQQEEVREEIALLAKSDAKEITEYLELGDTELSDFYRLFYYKHDELSKSTNEERKAVISKSVKASIEASITPDKLKKLNTNPKLFKKLTH
ncbi:hypothetical protein LXD69_09110 [Flavobacterium sediminilitoris]|uniref:Uncharacterized protein n=1 Tax=Flavobacterium sediminilitoris TaxID=2024526 RepID=A0ABY4HHK2_9FLAO|nr:MULTISPECIES: hypothetical protein [Flavobacterium]UOX32215.1 hypothetical protein LXD69_09110 [Flavobacterium sediminilitoris]